MPIASHLKSYLTCAEWVSIHQTIMFAVYSRLACILIAVLEWHQELVARAQKHILNFENELVRLAVVVVLGEMYPSLVAHS